MVDSTVLYACFRMGQVPGQVPCDEPLVPCEPREVRRKCPTGTNGDGVLTT